MMTGMVREGLLVGENLRQLPTAWLDCWSWTEESNPRIVDLERIHILVARQIAADTVHSCTAGAAVRSSLLVHVKTYVDTHKYIDINQVTL